MNFTSIMRQAHSHMIPDKNHEIVIERLPFDVETDAGITYLDLTLCFEQDDDILTARTFKEVYVYTKENDSPVSIFDFECGVSEPNDYHAISNFISGYDFTEEMEREIEGLRQMRDDFQYDLMRGK